MSKLIILAIAILSSATACAGPTGTISGIVKTYSGYGGVPGARVTALSSNQTATTTPDSRGLFDLALKPGTYILSFQAPGYRVVRSGICIYRAAVNRCLAVHLLPHGLPPIAISQRNNAFVITLLKPIRS